jgi:2,4-dienoyl-CoA reductase-like NADH-dependent reductase (Old Yellow Enzyme family)
MSKTAELPFLFRPFTQRGLSLRNRVVVSPMCQYQAEGGCVTDWHYQHHARVALGGVAVGMVEATAVSPEGRITHGCTGLWSETQAAGLARIAEMYLGQGAIPAIQLAHAGRKASARRPREGARPIAKGEAEAPWRTISASAVPVDETWPAPSEMSRADIDRVVGAFADAAGRARDAGFKVVEIHGAHGYLIHQFLSPAANRRSDAYGGDRAARMRFALEVAEAVRGAWPDDLPVWYRTSAVDGAGIGIDDTIALARALRASGIDLIDCSSGGLRENASLRRTHPGAGFQVPYARAVRDGARIATMAVGFITEPEQAETILAEGSADLVAIGRELMADPNWVYRAALRLGHPDPHGVLPAAYGFYLERRANLAR